MDIFDGRYYKSCKWFLVHIGLWPFQSNFKRRIGLLVWYASMTSLFVPQILMFLKEFGRNITVTYENTIFIAFVLGCSAKFSTAYLKMAKLRLLLNQITIHWKIIKDKTERKILKKYNEQGRTMVIIYTCYIFSAWLIISLVPWIPYILDTIFPLQNGTRPLLLSFYADYIFFEQVDYHYWTVCHASLVYFQIVFLCAGIDTTFVLTVKHTSGLFAVICYRLNIKEKNTKSIAELNKKIKMIVTLHNQTIRCCKLIEDSFSTCFLFVKSLGVFGLTIGLVYVFLILDDLLTQIRFLVIAIGMTLHLLYLHWVGQQIINSSEETLNSAEWYLFSLSSRKLINIIITRSLYPCYLSAGKITDLSMESYEKLLKCVASYCTVFLSMV